MFEIQVVNLDESDRRLARIALLLSDLRAFWPLVTRLANAWTARQFDTEGSFEGDPWEQLSPEYAAWKDSRYPGHPILSRTGALRRAATTPTRLVTPTSLILMIEPYDTESGTVEPIWFQEGTSRMPARPIVPVDQLPAEALAELQAVGDQYVREILAQL